MNANLQVVALGVSVLSLAVGAGCQEQELRADQIPTYVQVEAPTAAAAKAVPANPSPVTETNDPSATAAVAATAAAAANAKSAAATTNVPAADVMPDDLKTSPALTELVRLLQGGVSEEILMAYITNSAEPFYIGADEILFLHDLGTPTSIITTLIHRDSSPEMMVRKQAAVAVKPLPPGVSLTTPATNLYATASPSPAPPAPAPVADNPPEP